MGQKKSGKPIIGLTMDHEAGGGYSVMPWYALRENYCTSISKVGGVPMPMPHEISALEDYLAIIDGLVVTGGAFDVDPAMFGAAEKHESVTLKENRTRFEYAILKACLEQNKPILGICGGEQLLNVVLGGTLIQHIPDAVHNCLEHEQKAPRSQPGHVVSIKPATLLHRITDCLAMNVNTAHHQAVDKPGRGVVINAIADDGVIEGIEYPAHPFCLGVQWHPEYEVDAGDSKILQAFIKVSQTLNVKGYDG